MAVRLSAPIEKIMKENGIEYSTTDKKKAKESAKTIAGMLIKGMKMPSSCPKCDFCSMLSSKYTITNIPYCELIGTEVSPYEKDKDCPLVEVDASFKRFAEIAEEAGMQGKEAKFRINGRLFAVRELPQ